MRTKKAKRISMPERIFGFLSRESLEEEVENASCEVYWSDTADGVRSRSERDAVNLMLSASELMAACDLAYYALLHGASEELKDKAHQAVTTALINLERRAK